MSTRSTIWMKTGNDSDTSPYTGIYCHFDGYPSNNGRILEDFYTDEEKILELLNLGNISSLGNTIEGCIAYHRDREEDFNQYYAEAPQNYEEWMYVFDKETQK